VCEVYTAPAPEGVGDEKYDATATSMVALLKYGTGLPFNRIETLQAGMGIPLAAATQWDLVRGGAKNAAPAHEELLNQADKPREAHHQCHDGARYGSVMRHQLRDVAFVVHMLMQDANDVDTVCRMTVKHELIKRAGSRFEFDASGVGPLPASGRYRCY
jgi:hypothetical protein